MRTLILSLVIASLSSFAYAQEKSILGSQDEVIEHQMRHFGENGRYVYPDGIEVVETFEVIEDDKGESQ